MLRSRCHSGGFSLVEMVAALIIFSTGVLATMEVFTVCLRSTGTCKNYTRAVLLAQGLVEETLAEGIVAPGEERGEFGESFPNATWTREIMDTETTGLYEIGVRVVWPAHGNERMFELTTLAAER